MSEYGKHAGFSLIEVLIAVLVLSIGLLGLAALQSLGIRFTHDAYLLTVATQQAEDMAERMRTNPSETIKLAGTGGYDSLSGLGVSTVDCETASCISTDRALFDHAQWSAFNQSLFGVGKEGSVTRNGDVFNITLNWNEINSSGGADTKKYTMVFKP